MPKLIITIEVETLFPLTEEDANTIGEEVAAEGLSQVGAMPREVIDWFGLRVVKDTGKLIKVDIK